MGGKTVLVVEDDDGLRSGLVGWLQEEGYSVLAARTGREGLNWAWQGVDVILLDYRLPDIDGFEVLHRLQQAPQHPPVIMLTGHSSVDHAVEAMRQGAFHYLSKPVDPAVVSRTVRAAAEAARRRRSPTTATGPSTAPTRYIVGQSPAIVRLREMIGRLASNSDATVLVEGESGTGKCLVAQALHAASQRADKPFTHVVCAARSPSELRAELFGRQRNADDDAGDDFPSAFERSKGGTLFLDEVDGMDLDTQTELLRALERGHVGRADPSQGRELHIRVIASAKGDLSAAVIEGRVRADLYYRLTSIVLRLPALRERGEDIPLLTRHFIDRFGQGNGSPPCRFDDAAMDRLVAHDWPGNVRELRNVVERMVIVANGRTVGPDDIQLAGPPPSRPAHLLRAHAGSGSLPVEAAAK